MASETKDLRPDVERPATAERFGLLRLRSPVHLALLLGFLATILFTGLMLAGSHGKRSSTPAFLTKALGSPQNSASLVRKPAPGVTVRVGRSGYTVARRGGAVSLAARGAGRGGWERFEHGVSRPAPFGRETVALSSGRTEDYLTVLQHQGVKTWQWNLDAHHLMPRVPSRSEVIPAPQSAKTYATLYPCRTGLLTRPSCFSPHPPSIGCARYAGQSCFVR